MAMIALHGQTLEMHVKSVFVTEQLAEQKSIRLSGGHQDLLRRCTHLSNQSTIVGDDLIRPYGVLLQQGTSVLVTHLVRELTG